MKCGNKTVQKYTDDFIEKAMQIEDVTEADLLHDYLKGLPTDIRLAVKRRGVMGLEAVMIVADEEDQLIQGKHADGSGHTVQQRNTDRPAPMEIDRLSHLYALSHEQVQRHIREDRCFNCHQQGHRANRYPKSNNRLLPQQHRNFPYQSFQQQQQQHQNALPRPDNRNFRHMGVSNPLMQPQGPVVPSGLAPSPMQHQQMWQPAARPVTDFPPGLWGSQQQNQNAGMQNRYPFRRYYSTKTSHAPRKLIRFHGRLAGVPVRCLYDTGADLNFFAHSVAELNRFTLWDLDEPTAYKGGLNGGPQLPISQEVKGLPLCIQGFSAPLDLTVVDLDDDYDVVLGMPFCEEYIPIPHYCEKALTIPACESPTGRDLLLLDSEEYPAEEEGEDFFSQRELRRLMKRPSSRVHLFRLEAVQKGGVSDTLEVHSLQSVGKLKDPPPLSSFPPDHPINSSTYTGFRKHLQSKEVPPSVRPVLKKHFDRFPDELPGLPPHRKIECEIKLEAGHSPPMRAPYRLLYGQLIELRRQLDSYLKKGHIRPSTSPYAAGLTRLHGTQQDHSPRQIPHFSPRGAAESPPRRKIFLASGLMAILPSDKDQGGRRGEDDIRHKVRQF
uniref:Uncharacterized protein n=1 Tax=Chromera velia CCMP2878 TaxID=1169474 RepID=A0A0G4HEY6_9ALVE|eukprot:Cvel_26929.t1-p1 / transcript=Cvel_26929.t1 / gene=Cvel_26929 / organism=Chromera_velia_CCMP2878 / gene_product=RNA-directed DNA polymerase homolog, putative / transcript_product=RNA-directed DNA polymerase homolog, putative / location=Cvel_scaffold3278:9843-11666(-) / protein_length=608 / sequence_SO=supercontig / SO=protein_coding / is_pseudo=false